MSKKTLTIKERVFRDLCPVHGITMGQVGVGNRGEFAIQECMRTDCNIQVEVYKSGARRIIENTIPSGLIRTKFTDDLWYNPDTGPFGKGKVQHQFKSEAPKMPYFRCTDGYITNGIIPFAMIHPNGRIIVMFDNQYDKLETLRTVSKSIKGSKLHNDKIILPNGTWIIGSVSGNIQMILGLELSAFAGDIDIDDLDALRCRVRLEPEAPNADISNHK